jgi:hypothetical protein
MDKMNTILHYCPECLAKLNSWGEIPTAVFECICEFYATQGTAFVFDNTDLCIELPSLSFVEIVDLTHDRFSQMIEFLEERVFVVSTETIDSTCIAVRPTHFQRDEDLWFFCLDKTHCCFKEI